jgi:hypothetical protein
VHNATSVPILSPVQQYNIITLTKKGPFKVESVQAEILSKEILPDFKLRHDFLGLELLPK